ncbi:MAG TPA: flagellar basal body P-ring protein FlgI [Humisphaera sp.]|jgi:flagellar P-ring protein precursor FlgI|nr:flagellar basal body P-ring protein FlgI [Humisphaera sp.]
MRQLLPILCTLTLLLSHSAQAVRIADITRLNGQRTNVLTGLGLVYGLKGTGDGGDFAPAIRPLAGMLGKFSDPATIQELNKVQNVAVVALTAVVPSDGARAGDQLDVRVTSLGDATSLKGGRLFVSPMLGPVPGSPLFALAHGPVELEDASDTNVGVVPGGAVMEADLPVKYIENGRISLIIAAPSANWTTANLIAKTINDAEGQTGEQLAFVVDAKEVVVTIPMAERERPDGFISRVLQLPIPILPTEARVQINKRTGTLIITGDVEISPVVISHQGLTIDTTAPAPVPSARAPITTRREAIPVQTGNQGGARLQDLVNALEQIRVPVKDRIEIIEELYKEGKLHAKLIED